MTAKKNPEAEETLAPKNAAGDAEAVSFETAMARLEKVVGEMEEGRLPLEQMIARFEEGQRLVQFCSKKLNEVEKRVEILVKKGGAQVAEPFSPGEAESHAPAADKDDAPF
jgi:exodeoxyribonuclease VII small subunit